MSFLNGFLSFLKKAFFKRSIGKAPRITVIYFLKGFLSFLKKAFF